MSKSELKNMYDLIFRWWKDEVRENRELLTKYEALKAENISLKKQIHEQSKNSLR
ncbi:hypothetical protein SAMN05444682_115108 [Parapedobacter indicus]|uniref:Uncharacterized protein n=1 Tax=Parapedobacter indicus TaxID=1477437 RepID=A0A1I3UYZ6_9SPHI|nr:hypothetical protein CLV26_11570 [Parapedobacter indicus]SFJ87909.1 hypothetical protein SAMN05444682_115108 [Parapedobacter indicus]